MRKLHLAAAILLAAILLSSCGEKNPSQSASAPDASQSQITFLEKSAARTLALAHADLSESQATFTEEKLETDDGQKVYEFEFFTNTDEYDYKLSAVTGEILSYHKKARQNPNSGSSSSASSPSSSVPSSLPASSSSTAMLTLDDAKAKALSHANLSANEATFIEGKIDYDDGRQVYDLEFITNTHKYDYEIDVFTGEVLSHESKIQQTAGTGNLALLLTIEEVKKTALAHAGLSAESVTFTKEKLDYDDGRQVYDLEFITSANEYDYEIDAATGEILSHKTEIRLGSAVSRPPASSTASVSLEQAKELVLAHAGLSAEGTTFTKEKLDYEDGQQIYELEFFTSTAEYEYEVDLSGNILSAESETRH